MALSDFPTATIAETIIVFDNLPLSKLGLASLTKMHDIFAVGDPFWYRCEKWACGSGRVKRAFDHVESF